MTTPNDPQKRPPQPGVPAPKPVVPQQGVPAPRVPPQPPQQPRPATPGQPPAPGARPPQPGVPAGQRPASGGVNPSARPGVPPQPGKPVPAPPKPGVPQQGLPAKAPAPAGAKPPPQPGQPVAKAPPQPGKPPAAKPPAGRPSLGKPGDKKPKPTPVRASQSSRTTGRRLGQILVDLGFIDDVQLEEMLYEAKAAGNRIGEAAIAKGLITEQQLYQALAEQFSLRLLTPEELKPTPEALTIVPETMSGVYKVLPLTYRDSILTVCLSDPVHLPGLDDLRNFLGCKEIVPNLALPQQVQDVLAKCYLGKEESIMDIISSLNEDDDLKPKGRENSIDLESLMEMQDAAPVRKLLNMVMLMAIKDRASDIHFEPFEEEYKMRYRCDGVLYEMLPPPRHLATAISTRIKVMSNLDIAERRLPQDGRIELNVGGNPVDLRVSILPTLFGESVVIRVLDRGNVGLDLNRLGMEPMILDPLRTLIKKPNGIVLVTGPTGSGKTTTLYSCLSDLNEITDKLITTEDPVEYDIDGIIQVPINSEIGVTFASALRAILRQDPDRILVGEIRDLETAQIAVQAALTGHMVFSTLHTNDAPSTIARLRDMGLESFLITATVEAILAQRLVRKICQDCKTEFQPSPEILMELNLKPSDVVGKKFYFGKGCDRCNNSGHKGRLGIHELLIMNDELRDMISAGASTDQLTDAVRKMGMSGLRESGLRAIWNGLTTIDEVVHETVTDDF